MHRSLPISPFAFIAAAIFPAVATAAIYVDPAGDDARAGTAADPVASVGKAVALSRAQGDREIRLKAGTYRLAEPIRLDGRDAGLRVIAEGAATLSGGAPVAGWKAEASGHWRAKCPVEGAPRELFTGERRAARARFPNDGWLRIGQTLPDRRSGFTFGTGDLPDFVAAGGGLELVFLHDWSISRLGVASIDRGTLTLRTAFPVGSSAPHYAIDHFEKQPRYALEGSPALIDAPGEWALDGGDLVYRPREGETPDSLDATVPRLRQLVEIAPGADGAAPADIRFEGIAFAHCRWDTPAEGYASGQATKHDRRDGSGKGGQTFIPAAVRVAGASKIAFQNCRFAHLGGSGVWIGQGASDCRIDGGAFADISGNAINIGEQGTENVARNIAVDGATVAGCGAQFFGSVGIWIGMAEGCAVERCEIRDLPYTGVSVGWRWDPTPSPCRGHRIAGNHIHHVMQVLSDGGGIYTLGRQPGTVLANNHIHDVPLNAGRAQSNGIFMDEGTTDLTVEGNLIHAIAKSPIRFHKAGENSIRRNTLGIGEGATAFTYNNTDPDRIRFEANRELPEGAPELSDAADAWAP